MFGNMDHLMIADIRFGSTLLPYPSYRALLKSEVRAKCSFLKEIFFTIIVQHILRPPSHPRN